MKTKHDSPIFPRGQLVFFVTSNINKFHEARSVFARYKLATAMLKMVTVEIQDDNLENIAQASAMDASKNLRLPIIVEDSGFFIKALKGFPGPYSSYVYQTVGTSGILKLMKETDNRDASFFSVITYCSPTEAPISFRGKSDGKVPWQERGGLGFGFDPIFEPDGGNQRTFAEMTITEKNVHSHRAKALQKFAEWYTLNAKRRF